MCHIFAFLKTLQSNYRC